MAPSCPNRFAARWSTSFFGRRVAMPFTSCLASREKNAARDAAALGMTVAFRVTPVLTYGARGQRWKSAPGVLVDGTVVHSGGGNFESPPLAAGLLM